MLRIPPPYSLAANASTVKSAKGSAVAGAFFVGSAGIVAVFVSVGELIVVPVAVGSTEAAVGASVFNGDGVEPANWRGVTVSTAGTTAGWAQLASSKASSTNPLNMVTACKLFSLRSKPFTAAAVPFKVWS